MKYFWLVIQIRYNGKYAAHPCRVSESDNLMSVVNRYICEPITANICESKKKAEMMAKAINDQFKKDGVFLYDGE